MSTAPDDSNWVSCDACEKWRKLPKFVDMSTLPEHWLADLDLLRCSNVSLILIYQVLLYEQVGQ